MPSLTPLHFYLREKVQEQQPNGPETTIVYGHSRYFTNCRRFLVMKQPDGCWQVMIYIYYVNQPVHQLLTNSGLEQESFKTRTELVETLTAWCESEGI